MTSVNPSRLERALSSPKSACAAMFGAMLIAFDQLGAILTANLKIVIGSLISGPAGILVLHFACRQNDSKTDLHTASKGKQP